QGNCILSIGDIHLRRSELDLALLQYEKALPLFVSTGEKIGQGNCIRSIGDIHLQRSELDLALLQYEKALPLFVSTGAKIGQGNCILSIGDIHLRRSELDLALLQYEKALSLFVSTGAKIGQSNCRLGFALVSWHYGDMALALEQMLAAHNERLRSGDPAQIAWTCYALSYLFDNTEEQTRFRTQAQEYWEKYLTPEQIEKTQTEVEAYLPRDVVLAQEGNIES
ncbi:MAG: hypothetical protein ACRCUT_10300, partial [Spirochaetota bacterium]